MTILFIGLWFVVSVPLPVMAQNELRPPPPTSTPCPGNSCNPGPAIPQSDFVINVDGDPNNQVSINYGHALIIKGMTWLAVIALFGFLRQAINEGISGLWS